MTLGMVQSEYRSMEYSYSEKTKTQSGTFETELAGAKERSVRKNQASEDSYHADNLETRQDYYKFLKEIIEKIYAKVLNGDTEPSFQIGAGAFTEKEWNKLIEEIDSIEEDIKELLASDYTSCTYPTANPDDDDILYITWYNEDYVKIGYGLYS